MNKPTLRELYASHTGNMSDKWSLYLREYDRLFAPMSKQPVRLLEIGIQNGGSLAVWSRFFPNAPVIVGCDINPDCARLTYDDPRISVIVGDANDSATQDRVLQRALQFDIVIDDGSHLSSDIVKSFALYFPLLADGGVFVAEDLHCSYWQRFEGGLYYPYSSIAFFKLLADVINHEHWGIPNTRAEVLRGIFDKYGVELSEDTLSLVHSVEFINSMCVVRKSPPADNGLGERVICGTLELVVPAHQDWNGAPYVLDTLFDQTANVWSSRSPPGEVIVETERALAAADDKAVQLEREIDQMKNSLSWRVTAGLRSLKNLARRFSAK